jgi:predicted DNA-binding transcriptional regulator YafY
MCRLRNDLRSFRLDRVKDVALLDLRFERPAGFDALDQLAHSIATLPRANPIEVLLHTDLKTARNALSLTFGLLELTQGGVLLRSSADSLAWFARQLAGLPFAFEIRTPARLRIELRLCAERLRALAMGTTSADEVAAKAEG